MKSILLAFANPYDHLLPSLQEEDKKIYDILSPLQKKGIYTISRISHSSRKEFVDQLLHFQQSLEFFYYSGHAAKSHLLFEDGKGMGKGLAGMLASCPNLKIIFLNGCSTLGHVKQLCDLPNRPAVIASHFAVEDSSAAQFGIRFFQSLVREQMTLSESFNFAFSAIQFEGTQPKLLSNRRELLNHKSQQESVWGIFVHEENSGLLDWRITFNEKDQEPKMSTTNIEGNEIENTGKSTIDQQIIKNKKVGKQIIVKNLKGDINL